MSGPQSRIAQTIAVLQGDPVRWRLLGIVADLGLPDCWIAAGFVRNAVWDALHDRPPQPLDGDVDVIWFDAANSGETCDRQIEAELRSREPTILWSVKNQARMHTRNGDAPYRNASDAMRYWPETATAVAARRVKPDACEISCPFGLDDLFNLWLRPAGRFQTEKRAIFDERVRSKAWCETWPRLKEAEI